MGRWRIAAAAAAAWGSRQTKAEPPPGSAFGRVPAIIDAEISPDEHVAILGGTTDQRVVSIATIDQPGLPALGLGAIEAISLRWVGDDHVLARIAAWRSYGPRESYRFERNIAIDLQGKVSATLLDRDPNSVWLVEQRVLGVTQTPPRAFVVGLVPTAGSSSDFLQPCPQQRRFQPVHRELVQRRSGELAVSRVEVGTPDTVGWNIDLAGRPRLRIDLNDRLHRVTVLWRPADGRYTPAWTAQSTTSAISTAIAAARGERPEAG